MPSKTLSDFKDRFLKPSPTRSKEHHAAKHTLPASFALFLISIFIPFERAFWQGIIARRRELYPHVNFDHLCFADVLRICIQTIFLALFTTLPVRDFWQFNPLARFVRAVIRAVGRIGEAIGRLGGRIIFNIGANIVKSRRRVGREHVSKFQNSIFWAAGIVAGLLAVLCITQPFNVQGQVVFLSIVLLLVCMAFCCLSVLIEQLSSRLLTCGLGLTIILLLEIRLWRWWNAFDFLKTRKILIPCYKCHSTSLCALHADSSRLQKELGMSDEIRGVSIYCKKCDITLLTFWWLLPN